MAWVVVQEGVYMHDVWGPFDTPEAAEAQAQLLAATDGDDYHCYTVYAVSPHSGLGQPGRSFAQEGRRWMHSDGVTRVPRSPEAVTR
jgi:hypothetical protein